MYKEGIYAIALVIYYTKRTIFRLSENRTKKISNWYIFITVLVEVPISLEFC